MKKIWVILLISLFLITSVRANFFEDIWEDLTGEIEEELERSRIGREINRIVEDLEAIGGIAQEVGNIASVVTSVSPPLAVINLAVQYGHNSDALWGRFQERVDTLENNNPGGGSGPEGSLSETELAGALQSVLEEPPLPEGIYLGDSCIVDLTNCPEENTRTRGDYYFHSCYLEGTVNKKKINGLNKPACLVHWIDAGGGSNVRITFPVDAQSGQYEWERCARPIIQPEEQREFLRTRGNVCNQPIAQYEVGDVCLVDYTSCGYGAYGGFNANRIGTISYGQMGTNGRQYSCSITYGNYALKESLRDSCSDVYVGQYEVNDFIAEHPEPVQQPIETPVKQTEIEESEPALGLGDIPEITQQETIRPVYGRNGITEITPPTVTQRKTIVGEQLRELGVSKAFSIDDIKERAVGYEIPSPLNKIFKNERAEIRVHRNYADDLLVCLTLSESIIKTVGLCSEEDSFEPTIKVQTSQTVLEQIGDAEDVEAMLKDKRITYEATGLGKKIKLGVSVFLFRLFN